jgi:Uncharacterized protein conserved in bacteria (DUF2147)
MKRLCGLVVLMLFSSAAQADTISFSVGGHRIRIDAPRGCRSSSCAAISIPGVYESRRRRDDDNRDVAASPPPAPAPAPAQVAPPPAPAPAPAQQSAPPPPKPVVATVPQPTPLAVYKPAAVATQEVAPPLPPVPQAPPPTTVTQPCTTPPVAKTDEAVRPAPATPPPALKVLHEEDPDSPLGDWQTEGKGMVRIAECGRALCGYAFKEGESEKGEAILINMKPKSDLQWSGSVYSKDSGDTYYGTMRMKGPNMLRVEACAFSRFYCNGSNWTRITSKPMVTSRQVSERPRT